jgi:hypothetical protein
MIKESEAAFIKFPSRFKKKNVTNISINRQMAIEKPRTPINREFSVEIIMLSILFWAKNLTKFYPYPIHL